MKNGASQSIAKMLAVLAAGVIVFLFYLPSLNADFVNFDDSLYVHENAVIRETGAGFLKSVFGSQVAGIWHPLTIISLAVDLRLWGLDPFGFHLTNVLFHSLNAALLALLTTTLAGRAPAGRKGLAVFAGFAAALLWGLHPQRVESVAWVSERKDVLFAFFFLLSVIAYVRFTESLSRWAYVGALVLFGLSLMSKPMAVSLPIVLLLYDLWSKRGGLKRLLLEKAPFIALAAIASVIAVMSQASEGAVVGTEMLGGEPRALNAIRAYGFYLYKMAVPTGLAPYYPLFPDFASPEALAGLAVLLAITALCALAYFEKIRAPLFAWAFYLVTLLPVIGVIQLGGQAAADRYTYLPVMPMFMLAGFGLSWAAQSSKARTAAAAAIFLAVSSGLGVLTVKQIGIWKDSHSLWSHEIRHYPIVFAYKNRAAWLHRAGRYREAVEDYSIIIENAKTKEELSEFHSKRGQAYRRIGDDSSAIEDFTKALSTGPADAALLNNRGNAFTAVGRYGLAIEDFRIAIMMEPRNAYLHYNLGYAYIRMGEKAEGLRHISAASGLGLREAGEFLKQQDSIDRIHPRPALPSRGMRFGVKTKETP